MRCQLCKPITIGYIRDCEIEHHRSLADLKHSADSGCELCILFFKSLQQNATNSAHFQQCLDGKDGWNTSITLFSMLTDLRKSGPNDVGENKLWVYSGQEGEPARRSGSLRLYARFGMTAVLEGDLSSEN